MRLLTPRGLRFAEVVPSPRTEDARSLRGLPAIWAREIDWSDRDAARDRAQQTIAALAAAGRAREAAGLRRTLERFERMTALHAKAHGIETAAQLLVELRQLARTLAALRVGGRDWAKLPSLPLQESRVWGQAGVSASEEITSPHGPAFRETAALQNRAYRALAAAMTAARR